MKYYLLSVGFLLFVATIKAQTSQIARVSNDGTTTVIYTDIKKAMYEAQDGDFIYLPGATFTVDSLIFRKSVNVIGTGIYPDSTKVSGKTLIIGNVYRLAGAADASLQGVEISSRMDLYGAGDFTFSKSKVPVIGVIDFSPTAIGSINISECIITNSIYNISTPFVSKLFFNLNNSFINDISGCGSSTFTNCIFYNFGSASGNLANCRNNIFKNCIFRVSNNGSNPGTSSGNVLYNSHIENMTAGAVFSFSTDINTTYDGAANTTFAGGPCPTTFTYSFDYHIKAGSLAAQSGSDGTDKGIYGSLYPYNPNPYNPHIYFKSIAPTTNAQGKLQINIKVKAQ